MDLAKFFDDLEPKTTTLKVGGVELILAESTCYQNGRIFKALTALDLGDLIVAVVGILRSPGSEGGSLIEGLTVASIIERAAGHMHEIWTLAQKVLGDQLFPALLAAAVAALDTPENYERLVQTEKLRRDDPDAPPRFERDGSWLGCEAARGWLADHLTGRYAARVMRVVWELNGYLDIAGNLLPLVTAGSPGAKGPAAIH